MEGNSKSRKETVALAHLPAPAADTHMRNKWHTAMVVHVQAYYQMVLVCQTGRDTTR